MRGSHALALATGILGLAIGFLARWMLARDESETAGLSRVPELGAAPADPITPPEELPSLSPTAQAAPVQVRHPSDPDRPSEPPGKTAGVPVRPPPPMPTRAVPNDAAVIRVTVLRHDGSPVPEINVFAIRAAGELNPDNVEAWWTTTAKENPHALNGLSLGGGSTSALGARDVNVPGGGRVLVGFWKPYVHMRVQECTAGELHEVELRLPPPGRPAIFGTIWDAEGRRLTGTLVRARWLHAQSSWVECTTSARGEFALPRLRDFPGSDDAEIALQVLRGSRVLLGVGLRVTGDNCAVDSIDGTGRARLLSNGPDPQLELALPEYGGAVTIRGRVQLAADVTTEELEIEWRTERAGTAAGLELEFVNSADVDDDGAFTFVADAPATLFVKVIGPDCGSEELSLQLTPGGTVAPLALVVAPQVRPTIEVRNAAGDLVECEVELDAVELAPTKNSRRDDWGIPGLGGDDGSEMDGPGQVRIPWGLTGRWRLTVTPDDDLRWRDVTVEFDGGKHPRVIVVPAMVPVLSARVRVVGGDGGDLVVEGRWTSGGTSGELYYGETEDDTGAPLFVVACDAPSDVVTVELAVRILGYRPVKIGPVTLRDGRPLDVTELVFTRD